MPKLRRAIGGGEEDKQFRGHGGSLHLPQSRLFLSGGLAMNGNAALATALLKLIKSLESESKIQTKLLKDIEDELKEQTALLKGVG